MESLEQSFLWSLVFLCRHKLLLPDFLFKLFGSLLVFRMQISLLHKLESILKPMLDYLPFYGLQVCRVAFLYLRGEDSLERAVLLEVRPDVVVVFVVSEKISRLND